MAVCYVNSVKELEIKCRYDDELFEYLKVFYKFRQILFENDDEVDAK